MQVKFLLWTMQQRHSNLILENIAIRTRLLLYILGAIMVFFLIWGLFERKLYDKDDVVRKLNIICIIIDIIVAGFCGECDIA